MHTLPQLPYDRGALAPVLSARAVDFHYGKHHQACVDKLNKLVEAWGYRDLALERIIAETAGRPERAATFNHAATVWNHNFYWRSLRPRGGGTPPAILRQKIEDSFGSVRACTAHWAAMAAAQFGSGWAWLVLASERVEVLTTGDAGGPLTLGVKPLLALDLWEHAYYLDHQNRRSEYVNAVLERLIDWGFGVDNLGDCERPPELARQPA